MVPPKPQCWESSQQWARLPPELRSCWSCLAVLETSLLKNCGDYLNDLLRGKAPLYVGKDSFGGGSACPSTCSAVQRSHDRYDDLFPLPQRKTHPAQLPREDTKHPASLEQGRSRASSPETGGHVPLRSGNVTWEKLQGPQAQNSIKRQDWWKGYLILDISNRERGKTSMQRPAA